MDYLQLAGFAAAGGIGGFLYWVIAEREMLLARLRVIFRR